MVLVSLFAGETAAKNLDPNVDSVRRMLRKELIFSKVIIEPLGKEGKETKDPGRG